MNSKTSMQDIADLLGISKNAVSLALNHKAGVSEELRTRVFEAAHQLKYRTEAKAKKKQSHLLVLFPEYIQDDKTFYYEVFWSIEKKAKENGYTAIISGVSKEMERLLILPDLYHEMALGGVLIIGAFHPDYVSKLKVLGTTLVTVDHCYDSLQLDAVVTANAEEAYKMVTHLVRKGHRQIGFIGAGSMSKNFKERWYGFETAMSDAGLAVDRMSEIPENALDDLATFLEAMNKDTMPSAWFCANDRLAISLIQHLTAKGYRVPDDVSVVGFDDIEAAQLVMPRLTTIQVQREQLGYEAVELLIRRIEKGGGPSKISIYGELIERDSCREIRG
ncbi:LacI family DNA-binding transcriptional regulator [Paenibacillus aceris]|uniref:LacI family transcriptional regulator/LacI family purine nucleotide synthesis repressor n=1 Tax=Paenibacillus aceris TaxID=869555 RepID=A0ABS4I4Y6_9BACL|nr:LacI family DNA-binding transcriptional regulator [Paenibacillus aceris]MBP1965888.1 LacI family transcriptional regulator/LacI family purine nucleotide synthesis repressor [Paenibacillus aceris]NHW35111.1 LacI family transcriptional regulator [Paenibacillus aceris]